jgi:hypothetical protein
MKDTEIKLKEIMYEFESDLCGPLYDLVRNVFVVLCVCFSHGTLRALDAFQGSDL